MTRNNDTSYRQKGRAVFLAAIMVVSVVGVSVAFTGSAAATAPDSVDSIPQTVYPGQEFNTSVDNSSGILTNDEAFLVSIQRDAGDLDGTSLVRTLNPEATSGSDVYYEIDSTDLETGTEYGISNTSTFQGPNDTTIPQTFSVINEGFGAEFDDDSVDNLDNESVVELSSDRQESSYNLTVSVDGPDTFDADMIEDLFNARNGTSATVTNPDDLPLDYLGYDREDGDDIEDIRGDDYVTLNLANLPTNGTRDGSDLLMNFTRLDDNAGLPDSGEYEFEFIVSDTGATATDTIQISESDEDASFDSGTTQTAAGDIAEFNLSLEDTDETWVQFGSGDSDFTEVLYLQADDENEPMEVRINTRLLGSADVDSEDVYDTSNVDTLESGIHDVGATGSFNNVPEDAVLFGDDGEVNNNFNDYLNNIDSGDNYDNQLTRPLQSTDYQVAVAGTDVNVGDEALFDADPGGEANNQLASKVITLTQPTIGDITIHTAPEEAADDTSEVAEIVDAATPRDDEVALDDRLIVQVEATGIYGSLVTNASDYNDTDFDRLTDGADTQLLHELEANADEGINFEVSAESTTGNQDPLEIDLTASDSNTYLVLDEENGQFFLVADTSSDDAFENGAAPDSETSFTADLTYTADESDDRYEFASDAPFDETSGSDDNYPYLLQGETLSSSASVNLAPRSITFDNLNADDQVQAQALADAEISGTTNVAPGSDAELRISGDNLRQGNDLNITDDGSVTTTYDLEDEEVGNEFSLDFRVGGSSADTADGIVVEAIGDSDDGEETNETETDDGEEMDDGEEEPADDGETNESADGGDDGSTDDGTPGFGAVVALIALIGAALLAVRRQN